MRLKTLVLLAVFLQVAHAQTPAAVHVRVIDVGAGLCCVVTIPPVDENDGRLARINSVGRHIGGIRRGKLPTGVATGFPSLELVSPTQQKPLRRSSGACIFCQCISDQYFPSSVDGNRKVLIVNAGPFKKPVIFKCNNTPAGGRNAQILAQLISVP